MTVYYVRAPSPKLVKIGFAADARKRFSKMQTDSAYLLILAAVEDGGREVEAERHEQFKSFWFRGEWFRDEGELASHIDALPRPAVPARKAVGQSALGIWLAARRMTLAEFASLVGTTEASISRICNGVQFPRRDLMLAIIEATNWEVDANALLGVERPALRRAS